MEVVDIDFKNDLMIQDGKLKKFKANNCNYDDPFSVRLIIITEILPVTSIKPAKLSFFYFDINHAKEIAGQFPCCLYGKDENKNQEVCELLGIKQNTLNIITGNYVKKDWTDWLIIPIYNEGKISKFLKII